MRVATLIVLFLVSLYSDVHAIVPKNRTFSLDDFQRIDVPAFEVLPVEILKPGKIKCLGGNRVLTVEKYAQEMVVFRDFKTGKTHKFVSKGRGPRECLNIRDITTYGDSVYFSSIDDRKILVFHLDAKKGIVYSHEYNYDPWCIRAIPLPSGGILCLPMIDGRFIRIIGGKTENLGSFPPLKGAKVALNNISVQSMIAATSDGVHLCSAYQTIDCIEIYSNDFKSMLRLEGPAKYVAKVKVSETPAGTSFSIEPTINTFNALSVSDKGFIVGYIGQLFKEGDEVPRNIGDLLYFDWEGNCLKRFHLPEEVVYLDIDWEEGRMIGVTGGDVPKLVSSKLDLN